MVCSSSMRRHARGTPGVKRAEPCRFRAKPQAVPIIVEDRDRPGFRQCLAQAGWFAADAVTHDPAANLRPPEYTLRLELHGGSFVRLQYVLEVRRTMSPTSTTC